MENNRRKFHNDIECVKPGYANGISTQLNNKIEKEGKEAKLTEDEKKYIIKEAAKAYGKFLDALGCDWQNDPNSMETPTRVSKAYVNDLWKGRYESLPDITSFPSDGYTGMVIERNIDLFSMCSHHHQTINGVVHIGYVVGKEGRVIGLSKLNRIVEFFGRRGAIQEQLTAAEEANLREAEKKVVLEGQRVEIETDKLVAEAIASTFINLLCKVSLLSADFQRQRMQSLPPLFSLFFLFPVVLWV